MKLKEFQKWAARAGDLAPFQRRRALDALAAPDPDRASHGVIEERIFHIQNVNAYDSRPQGDAPHSTQIEPLSHPDSR